MHQHSTEHRASEAPTTVIIHAIIVVIRVVIAAEVDVRRARPVAAALPVVSFRPSVAWSIDAFAFISAPELIQLRLQVCVVRVAE